MSMAAFGSFLGGLSQGQQQQQAQKERAQYLAMLQQRQKATDDDKASSAEAEARVDLDAAKGNQSQAASQNFDSDPDAPVATDNFHGLPAPGGGPGPMPGKPPQGAGPQPPMPGAPPGTAPPQGQPVPPPQGGQPPMPGQPSVPMQMQQPGARPMPPQGQPQRPMPGQPMPQQAQQPQPGQARPGMPPQGAPQPQPGGQPPQGQQPPQGGQQPPQPQTPQAVMANLQQLQTQMQQPMAQKILSDPGVKSAHDATDRFVQGLQKDGVGFGPGQRKPNAVEMKELQLLHSRTELAATKAAKDVTSNEKDQVALGGHIATMVLSEARLTQQAKQFQQAEAGREDRSERAHSGGGASGGTADDFNSMTDAAKKQLVTEYNQFGPNALPWARSRGGSAAIKAFDEYRSGQGGDSRGAVSGAYKSDQGSLSTQTKAADTAHQRYDSMDKQMTLLEKLADKYGLPDNMPMTALKGYIDKKGGKEAGADRAALDVAYSTVQRDYGKLADGGSGAAAAHVDSLKNASDVLSRDFTRKELHSAVGTMRTDGKIVTDSYDDGIAAIKKRMGAGAGPAGAGTGSASGHVVSPSEFKNQYQDYTSKGGTKSEAEFKAYIESHGSKVGG